MKVTQVHIERTFNLGQYESLKVGFEAELTESDKPLEVAADLEMLIHQHYENRHAKANAATTPTPAMAKPTQTTTTNKSPMQLANENQAKREQAAKADPTICPRCGHNKKPQYDLCYNCFEEERAR
jgi:hypothetical protein